MVQTSRITSCGPCLCLMIEIMVFLWCGSTEEDLTMWLEPLKRHVEKDMPNFLLSYFMTDEAPKIRNARSVRGQRMRYQSICVLSILSRIGKTISYSRFLTWGICAILFIELFMISYTLLLSTKKKSPLS
jgi:hypothetical protein